MAGWPVYGYRASERSIKCHLPEMISGDFYFPATSELKSYCGELFVRQAETRQ